MTDASKSGEIGVFSSEYYSMTSHSRCYYSIKHSIRITLKYLQFYGFLDCIMVCGSKDFTNTVDLHCQKDHLNLLDLELCKYRNVHNHSSQSERMEVQVFQSLLRNCIHTK